MSIVFKSLEARPMPGRSSGPLAWLRTHLFSSWGNTALTLVLSALGLSKSQSMRLVVLPQALRVIIPPLTSQYLNLTKNSSLAVAIGYPELVSIANTTLNQTGRAIEALSIVMLVYLTLSLITSALMNWFNASAAIQER